MKNIEYVKNLYSKDEYIIKHPSLHEEDAPWKVSKIVPLINRFIKYINKDEINLLDVGGGTGTILNAVSVYIKESFGIKVNKLALDLSPGMLEIQKKRNPDLKRSLNEDIRKTSLGHKEIDLTLMVDVLEHILNPIEALQEIKRISNFVIFKVPLEDTILFKISNLLKRGKARQFAFENVGHINFYDISKLKHQIENHAGQVLDFYFTNAFDYFLKSEHYRNNMKVRSKLENSIASYIFKLSPHLSSLIFSCDFVMILVRCY